MLNSTQLFLLALAWLAYFIIHSSIASIGLKKWVAKHHSNWMPAYRLGFNLVAILLLSGPLYLLYIFQGDPLWQWQGYQKVIANTLRFAAIAGFIWTLRYYDGSEILGTRQLLQGEKSVEDQERFHISPLHRYVRHPWYFLGMVYLWAGDMEPAWLVSCIMLSLYFIVGSRIEERKLETYHGDIYKHYAGAVPGLVPLPWRYLTQDEATTMMRNYRYTPDVGCDKRSASTKGFTK